MAASTATWPWPRRTLTDRRNDITTIRSEPEIIGLTSRDVIHPKPGVIKLQITESGQVTRQIQFTVPHTPLPTWLKRDIECGGKLLLLPLGWNRQAAPPIDPGTIQSALDTLCLFMTESTAAPQWTPTQEGGVQLDWHERGIDLEIEFTPAYAEG